MVLFVLICLLFRFDAIEKVEDVLSGLRVIEFDGNHIRLSLRTYIPDSESLACQEKVDDSSGLLEQDHELLIEFMDGTMELKRAEVWIYQMMEKYNKH